MNDFINKILASKKCRAIIAAAAILGAVIAAYMVMEVKSNLKKMSEADLLAQKTAQYYPPYPKINSAGKDAALLKRGEYIAKAGDCIACHTNTPKKGATFAGGLPIPTPFGVIYSPNLTPDKETGIGGWTDEEFIKSMREGISPEGHYYYPAFPYIYFNNMSTEDLKALKAYLDSIPAIHQENRKNEMMFPFNIRFLQLGWRILFFHPDSKDGYQNNPHESAEWNRGAYLTEGLGHCAMCHTPSYYLISPDISLGAPIKKYNYSGAAIQGYLAPNISKSNLGTTPNQEVVNVFKKDMLIGGGNVVGPMLEVNHDSMKYMTDADLTDITLYLKSVDSESPPKPKSSGGPGASTYDTYCSGCHAMGAGGAPKFGDAAAWDVLLKSGKDKLYTNAIHGINGMPAKGTCNSCSDDQIKEAVDYMLNAASGAPLASAQTATPVPQLTMADGKLIYAKNCSSCHALGVNGAPKLGDMEAWSPVVAEGFIKAYENMVTGKNGHQPNGACPTCTDAELKAALKYMMQTSSHNNYSLW